MSKQFEDIKKGLLEAIDYENGKISAKRNVLSIAPLKEYSCKEIKKIRNSTQLSQTMFAKIMGVSNKTVEAWECGRNHPDGAATRLLQLIEANPNFPYDSCLLVNKNIDN